MILDIEDVDAFNEALKKAGDKLVVVDFTATWCGPCRAIAPFFHALSENPDNKNVVFLKVDVDDAGDVSSHCKISCMPTFQFYKKGEKIHEFSGANEGQLSQEIKNRR